MNRSPPSPPPPRAALRLRPQERPHQAIPVVLDRGPSAPPGDVPRVRLPSLPASTSDVDAQTFPADTGSTSTFEGPGIRVVVRPDRQVEVHTSDRWDGGVDEVYESCVLALRRALSEERVAVVVEACGPPRPGERPPPALPLDRRPRATGARATGARALIPYRSDGGAAPTRGRAARATALLRQRSGPSPPRPPSRPRAPPGPPGGDTPPRSR